MEQNQSVFKIFNRKKKTKVGIAFGGGGARGFAHLGVIKAFEEYGIKATDFAFISGTSAGSIVGSLYANGYSYKEMLEIAKTVDESEIRTSKIPLMPSKTDGIQNVLIRNMGDIDIKNLKVPFAAVACDLKTTKEIILTKGNLAKAVAASCCVPGVFVPVEFGNYNLCDGGLKNTIPTDVPKKFGCDYVIGVDVNKHRTYGTDSTKMINVISCSIRILMESNAIRGYLSGDVMIGPDTKRFSAAKATGFMDMIEEGYNETIDKMKEVIALLNKKPLKKRKKRKIMGEDVFVDEN